MEFPTIICRLLILRLLLFDCAIVVEENESTFVSRICIALCPLITRTQVARWVIFWRVGPWRCFLLSSSVKID